MRLPRQPEQTFLDIGTVIQATPARRVWVPHPSRSLRRVGGLHPCLFAREPAFDDFYPPDVHMRVPSWRMGWLCTANNQILAKPRRNLSNREGICQTAFRSVVSVEISGSTVLIRVPPR